MQGGERGGGGTGRICDWVHPPALPAEKDSHTLKRGLHTSFVRSPTFRLGSRTESQMRPSESELEPGGEGEAVEGVFRFDVGAAPLEIVVGADEVVLGLGEKGECAEV